MSGKEENSPSRPMVTKDELNLVEYPFSLPCHRHPKGKQVIHLSEQIKDPLGKPRLREWIVTGSSLYGLPLAVDEEVFLCVMYFLSKSNFETREILFTQYNLLKHLGWPTNKSAYQRLKQSLDRLRGVVIESRGTFWDHRAKCYITKSFNLIDAYALYDKEAPAPNDQPFLSSVTVSDFIVKSINAGFVRTLNFDFYRSLHLPIARKLFRVLDKKLHNGEVFEADLMRLAQRLAITDSLYPSKVKQNLRGPHEELIDRGVIKSAKYIRRGKTASVRYTITPRAARKSPKTVAPALASPQEHPLVKELTARGITPDVAKVLLAAHGEKSLAEKLEVFDHLLSEQSSMVTKNPAGFLRSSIEKNYAPPTGYVSRAERQRRKQEEDEARRRQRDLDEATAKTEAERQNQLDALWNSLPDADRAQIEEQVLSTMNKFARKAYIQEKAAGRVGAGHHALRSGVVQVLAARNDLPTAADPAALRELA